MTADPETLGVYSARAQDYATRFSADGPGRVLKAFIAALPQGACVLDLGCGPGTDAAHMLQAGLLVDAVDATPEMVSMARQKGVPARLGTFDELDAERRYDALWANFSLLHAQRHEMPTHLAAIHRALKPAGLFHIGLKLGTGEGRDALGRFYTYYTEPELEALLSDAGFSILSRHTFTEAGLAGTEDPGIMVLARAEGRDA